MFCCVLTYFCPFSVSRPLSSKWSAAPGRGESKTHTAEEILAFAAHNMLTYSFDTHTIHSNFRLRFTIMFMFMYYIMPVSSPHSHTQFCFCTCAHRCVHVLLFFVCISVMISILCMSCVVPACVCVVYILLSPPIPSPIHSCSCPISPCGFKGWGVIGLPSAFP